MSSQDPLKIPPQDNVVTLQDAMNRTNNWRQSVKGIYGGDETNMPHAIYIPFEDILEMAKLQSTVQEYAIPPSTTPVPIRIIGVRAYFSMGSPVIPTDKAPLSAVANPVSALLVPVFQTDEKPEGPGKYNRTEELDTYDLIAPVPTADNSDKFSIYDITRPCPNLCDAESKLL